VSSSKPNVVVRLDKGQERQVRWGSNVKREDSIVKRSHIYTGKTIALFPWVKMQNKILPDKYLIIQ
jgi:hypothetical protein